MEDWVAERARCTARLMMERVKVGVEADTVAREKVAVGAKFRMFLEGDVFGVIVENAMLFHRVKFAADDYSIRVSLDDVPTLAGTVALGKDGRCRIRVGDEEMELWQFRYRALEELFFKFSPAA